MSSRGSGFKRDEDLFTICTFCRGLGKQIIFCRLHVTGLLLSVYSQNSEKKKLWIFLTLQNHDRCRRSMNKWICRLSCCLSYQLNNLIFSYKMSVSQLVHCADGVLSFKTSSLTMIVISMLTEQTVHWGGSQDTDERSRKMLQMDL